MKKICLSSDPISRIHLFLPIPYPGFISFFRSHIQDSSLSSYPISRIHLFLPIPYPGFISFFLSRIQDSSLSSYHVSRIHLFLPIPYPGFISNWTMIKIGKRVNRFAKISRLLAKNVNIFAYFAKFCFNLFRQKECKIFAK